MLVAIGSMNPVKINAVRYAFDRAFPKNIYVSVDSPSGVSDMPMSSKETRLGAVSRAKYSIAARKGADFGVGVEGGVEKTVDGLMVCGYVCIVDTNGNIGIGGGTSVLLPKSMSRKVLEGAELGEVVDSITNKKNVKQKEGAIGILTNGITSREEYFRMATACALAPFLNKKLY
jgi:inosine/xanthosine triphosphatase